MSRIDSFAVRRALIEQDRTRRNLREAIELAREADKEVYRALVGVDSDPLYRVVNPRQNKQRQDYRNSDRGTGTTHKQGPRVIEKEEDWDNEPSNRNFILGRGFFDSENLRKTKRTDRSKKYKDGQAVRQGLLLPAPLSDHCN